MHIQDLIDMALRTNHGYRTVAGTGRYEFFDASNVVVLVAFAGRNGIVAPESIILNG